MERRRVQNTRPRHPYTTHLNLKRLGNNTAGYTKDTAARLVPMFKTSALKGFKHKALQGYTVPFHQNTDDENKKQPMEHVLGVISINMYVGGIAADTLPGRVVFRLVHEDHARIISGRFLPRNRPA